jgi:SH3 domain-containing protein
MSLHAHRPRAAALRLRLLKADTRRFAPRTQAVAASDQQSTFSPAIRTLVAVLALVALLPNLVLGAFFLRGVINTPWSTPVTFPPNAIPTPAPQSAIPPAVLSAPVTLEATAGEDVTFPIALDGTDGVPARSIIAISGLPQGSTLSSGRPYGETEWNLKPDEIGDLHLVLPYTASGEAKLIIQLVAPDGANVADTATVLKVTANSKQNLGAYSTQVLDERAQALGAVAAGESLRNATTTRLAEAVPLPTRRPVPTANNYVDANWIKPLGFVNLRDGPSPSARVIGVIASGTKLRVLGRKNRWVQVTHSATSKRGWIYADNVATAR